MTSDIEKALRLLEYLRKFTDKSNPTSMPLIDYYFKEKGCPDFFGIPESKRRKKRELIKKLAEILNTDMYGNLLPREEWIIVYDGYGEETDKEREFICNLYYNQPFTSWDVDDILKSIEQNQKLGDERKKELTAKIKRYVSNKNYIHENPGVRRGMNPVDKKKFLIDQKQKRAQWSAMIKQKHYDDF